MTHSRLKKLGAAGACAAIGAIAGIASSAAAPGNSGKARAAGGAVTMAAGCVTAPGNAAKARGTATMIMPAPGGAAVVKIGGPAVHSTAVVPNKTGDGFDTLTQDSGTVKSVSGRSLTITEGTDKATYATPTLTIATDATVERNFDTAKLADLQPGDHVDVSATTGGSEDVFAADSAHWPPKPPQFSVKGGGPIPLPPGAGMTTAAGAAFACKAP
jgi:hypothetical protein